MVGPVIDPTTTNFGRRPTEGGLEGEKTRVGVGVGVAAGGLLKTVVTHKLGCFSGTCQLEQA